VIFGKISHYGKMYDAGQYAAILVIIIGIILILVAAWFYSKYVERPDRDLFDDENDYDQALQNFIDNSDNYVYSLLTLMAGLIFLFNGSILYFCGTDTAKRWGVDFAE